MKLVQVLWLLEQQDANERRINKVKCERLFQMTFESKLSILSNLVDPASSHTLVSKIKPCMCKSK